MHFKEIVWELFSISCVCNQEIEMFLFSKNNLEASSVAGRHLLCLKTSKASENQEISQSEPQNLRWSLCFEFVLHGPESHEDPC